MGCWKTMCSALRLRSCSPLHVGTLLLASFGFGLLLGRSATPEYFRGKATLVSEISGSNVALVNSFLTDPPPGYVPYNLKDSSKKWFGETALQHDAALWPILSQVKHGFFVEAGALNGEDDSNTLALELRRNWTGLLVEPNPKNQVLLSSKNRHTYIYNGCLSTSGRVETMQFSGSYNQGTMSKTRWETLPGEIQGEAKFTWDSTCAPLGSILKMLNRFTVDFLNLDMEGGEENVLATIDFRQIEVGVVLVEINARDHLKVLGKYGFKQLHYDGGRIVQDAIFVNPAYFARRGLALPTALPKPPGLAYHDPARRDHLAV